MSNPRRNNNSKSWKNSIRFFKCALLCNTAWSVRIICRREWSFWISELREGDVCLLMGFDAEVKSWEIFLPSSVCWSINRWIIFSVTSFLMSGFYHRHYMWILNEDYSILETCVSEASLNEFIFMYICNFASVKHIVSLHNYVCACVGLIISFSRSSEIGVVDFFRAQSRL